VGGWLGGGPFVLVPRDWEEIQTPKEKKDRKRCEQDDLNEEVWSSKKPESSVKEKSKQSLKTSGGTKNLENPWY